MEIIKIDLLFFLMKYLKMIYMQNVVELWISLQLSILLIELNHVKDIGEHIS